jgi:hypothetical protein
MRLRPAFDRIRRPLAAGMVVAAAGLLALPTLASAQEGVRLETDLFGYSVQAEASPLSVLFYEDFVPLPVAPGDAQFQATNAYTRTTLNLGPVGIGVASNFWPGSAVGDGYGTVNCGMQETLYTQFFGPIPEEYRPPPQECTDSDPYPYEARAAYPGAGEESWTASQTTPPGATGAPPNMLASAKGLDVSARAQAQPDDNGAVENIAFGAASSESASVVTTDEAIATAHAVSQDISIFSGLITIDSVETRIRAVANTETGSTSGSTTFSGVRFLGQPVVFNENGIFLQPSSSGGGGDGGGGGQSDDCPEDDGIGGIGTTLCEEISGNAGQVTDPLQGIIDQFNAAILQVTADIQEQGFENTTGINIEPARHAETVDGAVARRSTGGMVVTVNMPVMLAYLDTVGFYDIYREFTKQFVQGFDQAWNQFPEEMREGFAPLTNAIKGYMVEFAGIQPKVEYVFGRASVQAGGSAGFVFELPEFDLPPPVTPAIPPPASTVLPNTPVTVPPVSGGVDTSAPPAVAAPQQPVAAGGPEMPMFGGVPLFLAALGLLALAAPTWGLTTLRESAVGINAAMDDGAPLPDLRALRGGS